MIETLIKFEKAQTYKPWIGNCLLKLQRYSERLRNARLPPRSYQLSAFPEVGGL